MFLRGKRVLLGLVTAAAGFAALPASALADLTASLSLDQTAGTTAGSSPALGIDAKFASTTGDGVVRTIVTLPPGLLGNGGIAGGTCLLSSTPNPACQVGTGTLSLAGGGSAAVTVYLVKPPNPADIEGLAYGSPPAVIADVTLGANGAATVVTSQAATVTESNVSFTDLRLPTSCPSPPANVTMTAVSQAGVSATATAPLVVTGCSGLSYAPTLAVSEAKDAKDDGATLGFDITQAANEAASQTIALKLPNGLGVNLAADATCLTGAGSGCVVGTATATSPLAPMKLTGTVTLAGSATSPTVTVSFPPPFAITLVGDVSLSGGTVTINNVPDIPLTDLDLTIAGPNGQKAFTTNCTPSSTTGTFTSQSGVTKTVTSNVTLTNCSPTASGSAGGLATGHPKLRIKASHGQGAANIASVTVGLPAGLKFSRSGITTSNACVTKLGKKKCTTTTLTKGLGVSGASVKSVALKGGKLAITLKKAAGNVTVILSGPVLTETSSLQSAVKKHKVKTVTVALKVTDAKHTTTSLPLKLKAD
jgi:hypothetical protein